MDRNQQGSSNYQKWSTESMDDDPEFEYVDDTTEGTERNSTWRHDLPRSGLEQDNVTNNAAPVVINDPMVQTQDILSSLLNPGQTQNLSLAQINFLANNAPHLLNGLIEQAQRINCNQRTACSIPQQYSDLMLCKNVCKTNLGEANDLHLNAYYNRIDALEIDELLKRIGNIGFDDSIVREYEEKHELPEETVFCNDFQCKHVISKGPEQIPISPSVPDPQESFAQQENAASLEQDMCYPTSGNIKEDQRLFGPNTASNFAANERKNLMSSNVNDLQKRIHNQKVREINGPRVLSSEAAFQRSKIIGLNTRCGPNRGPPVLDLPNKEIPSRQAILERRKHLDKNPAFNANNPTLRNAILNKVMEERKKKMTFNVEQRTTVDSSNVQVERTVSNEQSQNLDQESSESNSKQEVTATVNEVMEEREENITVKQETVVGSPKMQVKKAFINDQNENLYQKHSAVDYKQKFTAAYRRTGKRYSRFDNRARFERSLPPRFRNPFSTFRCLNPQTALERFKQSLNFTSTGQFDRMVPNRADSRPNIQENIPTRSNHQEPKQPSYPLQYSLIYRNKTYNKKPENGSQANGNSLATRQTLKRPFQSDIPTRTVQESNKMLNETSVVSDQKNAGNSSKQTPNQLETKERVVQPNEIEKREYHSVIYLNMKAPYDSGNSMVVRKILKRPNPAGIEKNATAGTTRDSN